MIDLDELQAAINRCAFDGDVLGLSKAECSDLLTRLRQAEKDAAKYWYILEMTGGNHPKLIASLANAEIERKMSEAMQCHK